MNIIDAIKKLSFNEFWDWYFAEFLILFPFCVVPPSLNDAAWAYCSLHDMI
jgi:hypothetical protein